MKGILIISLAIFSYNISFAQANSNKESKTAGVVFSSYGDAIESRDSKLFIPNGNYKFMEQIFIKSYWIVMSSEMYNAVKEYNPDFELWRADEFMQGIVDSRGYDFSPHESPQALFADFNGDDIGDAILWGHDKENSLLLFVESKKISDIPLDCVYKISTLLKGPYTEPKKTFCGLSRTYPGISAYLRLEKPRKIKSEFEKKELDLKTDGYSFADVCYTVDQVRYYKDGKWHFYTTGD